MKGCAVLGLLSLIAIVHGTSCPQGDLTSCGMTCATGQTLICKHDICTCDVVTPCLALQDCAGSSCDKHGESNHCIDGYCQCTHL